MSETKLHPLAKLEKHQLLSTPEQWDPWSKSTIGMLTQFQMWNTSDGTPDDSKLSIWLFTQMIGISLRHKIDHCTTATEAWDTLKPQMTFAQQKKLLTQHQAATVPLDMDLALQQLNSTIRTAKFVFGNTINTDYLFQLIFMDKLPANYEFQMKSANAADKFDFSKLKSHLLSEWENIRDRVSRGGPIPSAKVAKTGRPSGSPSKSPFNPADHSTHRHENKSTCFICNPCSKCTNASKPKTFHHENDYRCLMNWQNTPEKPVTNSPIANFARSLPSPTQMLFVPDSGANQHMAGNKDLLHLYSNTTNNVIVANNQSMPSTGIANFKCKTLQGPSCIEEILYCPSSNSNLLSISVLDKKGLASIFCNQSYYLVPTQYLSVILNEIEAHLILKGSLSPEGLYQVIVDASKGESVVPSNSPTALTTIKSSSDQVRLHGGIVTDIPSEVRSSTSPSISLLSKTNKRSAFDWHITLGHLNIPSLKAFLSLNNISLPSKDFEFDCQACLLGKSKQQTYKKSTRIVTRIGEVIGSDIWGPTTPSFAGNTSFMSFIDYFSNKKWIYLFKSQKDSDEIVINFLNHIETYTGRPVTYFHSDKGSIYTSNKLQSFFLSKGITFEVSATDAHQQNGKLERWNLTALQAVRTMLCQSNLDSLYWDEALLNYVYTHNLTHISKGLTAPPDGIWFSKVKPPFDHLHMFVEPCFAHIMPIHQSSKLDPRAYTGIFLGYDSTEQSYRILDKSTQSIILSSNVSFLKHFIWPKITNLPFIEKSYHNASELYDPHDSDYIPPESGSPIITPTTFIEAFQTTDPIPPTTPIPTIIPTPTVFSNPHTPKYQHSLIVSDT